MFVSTFCPSKISGNIEISTLLTNIFQVNTFNSVPSLPFEYFHSNILSFPLTQHEHKLTPVTGHPSDCPAYVNGATIPEVTSWLILLTPSLPLTLQSQSTNSFFLSLFLVIFFPFPFPYPYNTVCRLSIHSNSYLLSQLCTKYYSRFWRYINEQKHQRHGLCGFLHSHGTHCLEILLSRSVGP